MTRKVRQLRELLDGIARVPGVANREVRGLQIDSRRVQPGDLFLAVPGFWIGMLIVVGVVLMNLLADIGYAVANPQIRHES